jgi:hypothetical protein
VMQPSPAISASAAPPPNAPPPHRMPQVAPVGVAPASASQPGRASGRTLSELFEFLAAAPSLSGPAATSRF